MPTALSSAPVTSRWYGQGRAVDVVRRLESLSALSPSPGPAGVITAGHDDITVTFVEGLKAPLPQPWQPAGREARISWEAVNTDESPHPDHPVYLVVFGTTEDEALVGLNLAAFSRIRIGGDPATATALIARWVLELLATHPGISIGITDDAWTGPWTTRVQPVAPRHVPDVDVLVCGAALTYAERAQIVAASTSPIVLDLGHDAAVTTTWSISCGADQEGQISRGPSARPMSAALIVPAAEVVERCAQLLAGDSAATPDPVDAVPARQSVVEDDAATDPGAEDPASPADTSEAIDFFDDPSATSATPPPGDVDSHIDPASADNDEIGGPTTEPASLPACAHGDREPATVRAAALIRSAPSPTGAASPPAAPPSPVVAPIWNRILGRVALQPPHPGDEPGPRERRLNELTVFLQLHPWASTDDIIGSVYHGGASEKTVTQQISLLRKRIGVVRPGGPKALPPMQEGQYHLDNAVRSDWMEFERLVEILAETTSTAHLIAAMDLVTGPPLGGITSKEWPFTRDLRDELRDRVPAAAVVLARRHHDSDCFAAAVEVARQGLWYDSARQDLWGIALTSALENRDKETFRALRGQFLNTIPGPERDSAVFALTGRAG
jgi:hypothetical protein